MRTNILIGLKEGENSTNFIATIHDFLSSKEFKIEIGELYYLNDFEDSDHEPSNIVHPNKALEEITKWITAGWIHYQFLGITFLVSFIPSGPYKIGGVYISCRQANYTMHREGLDSIFTELFHKLNGVRLIRGEDIFEDFEPEEEVARILSGRFQGTYDLDISISFPS